MNYINDEIKTFKSLPMPEWNRIKLAKDLFDIDGKVERKADLSGVGVDVKKLSDILASDMSESDKVALLDHLNIDKLTSKSLGHKFSTFTNAADRNSYVIKPINKSSDAHITINYDIDDNEYVRDHYLIIVENGHSLEVNLNYLNDKKHSARHYGNLKVIAQSGSEVTINKVQILSEKSENFDQSFLLIEEGASAKVNDIQIGSKFKALAIDAKLMGRRSQCEINSIYFGEEDSLIDVSYTMNHYGKKSDSKILSKGALKKNSKKVFRGNLIFEKNSTASVGKEEEFVMLLDDKIKSDSIPALMCSEDDVIGEHAASVGQIDSAKMFYLMSRGLSEVEAKKLIVKASFEEILSKISSKSIKEIVNKEIEMRIL